MFHWAQGITSEHQLAHIAVAIAAGLVVCADGHEAGVLAARAGVGLQRHLVEARDLRQLRRQVLWECSTRTGSTTGSS